MEIWQQIRDKRDERGWTNAVLAEKSGVPEPTLQKFLAGKTADPRFDSVIKLLKALDMSADEACGIDSNASVKEVTELRRALEIAKANERSAILEKTVVETKLEAQIGEYNQMVSAYEYRIHISKDRVIWLRKFFIFACVLIVTLMLSMIFVLFYDMSNDEIGWLRHLSLYIGGITHESGNLCSLLKL